MTAEPAEALLREADRVADRLRVVAGRLATRDPAALDEVRAGLQELADLGADAEQRPRRPVPVLRDHALADQVLVLARDLATARDGAGVVQGTQALERLRRRL